MMHTTHRYGLTRYGLTLAALLWGAAALAGCGNVTVGGVGEAEVYMSGDANEPAPASGPAPARSGSVGTEAPAPAVAIVGALEGDLVVTATLSLERADGGVVVLTPASLVTVTLDLQGLDEPRVVAEPVPAVSYQAVTVRFTHVTADVTGGLQIDGVPFVGTVEVDTGGSLDVTEALAFVVEDGQTAELLVDLNADVWIPLLDVLTGTVTAEDFAAAVVVRER